MQEERKKEEEVAGSASRSRLKALEEISQARIKEIENAHVFLWLLKDMSWCSLWRPLGMIVSIPTVLMAAYIWWITRKQPGDGVHNFAVLLWLCANVTWMTGEFYYADTTRPIAQVFFKTGMLVLVIHYLVKVKDYVETRTKTRLERSDV